MSNGNQFPGKYRVNLSDTDVFPDGTVFKFNFQSGDDYTIEVTSPGSCAPTTDPLQGSLADGLLETAPFGVGCDGGQYKARFVRISSRILGGEVQPATQAQAAGVPDDGTPAGTYTAEEEGGGVET